MTIDDGGRDIVPDRLAALKSAVLTAALEWREADAHAARVEGEGRKLSDEGGGAAEAANDRLWALRAAVDKWKGE